MLPADGALCALNSRMAILLILLPPACLSLGQVPSLHPTSSFPQNLQLFLPSRR
jgi:hypothetical protein